MTLIDCHGFEESTTTSDYGTISGAGDSISSTSPRTGSQSLQLGNTSISWQCASGEQRDTFVVGMGIYSTGGKKELRFSADAGVTRHVTININADGSIDARRGTTSGTLLGSATSAGVFPANAWTYVEAKVKMHDTTGTVEVRLNGSSSPVLNLTGQDTKNAGTATTFDTFAFFGPSGETTRIDDFYWCNNLGSVNNDFLGDKKVVTLMPNGDGATTQFSLSTGASHYQLVDEKPRNTTDYVFDTVTTHIDLFDFENLPAGSQNVSAVQIELYANKSDAGTTMNFQRAARSGGTNYFGNSIALGTTFVYLTDAGTNLILETDPNTSAAWATSAVDSAQFGVKLITP